MNQTLSTFLKIGITALTIGLLLFGVAYSMTDNEAENYRNTIEQQRTDTFDSVNTSQTVGN